MEYKFMKSSFRLSEIVKRGSILHWGLGIGPNPQHSQYKLYIINIKIIINKKITEPKIYL